MHANLNEKSRFGTKKVLWSICRTCIKCNYRPQTQRVPFFSNTSVISAMRTHHTHKLSSKILQAGNSNFLGLLSAQKNSKAQTSTGGFTHPTCTIELLMLHRYMGVRNQATYGAGQGYTLGPHAPTQANPPTHTYTATLQAIQRCRLP